MLEVGSGTGVSGLAAAYLGAVLSVLTDLPYTLVNLKTNVAVNYDKHESVEEVKCSSGDSAVKAAADRNKPIVRALDWTDASTYFFPVDIEQSTAHQGHKDGSMAVGDDNSWDVIIGADVVWLEELVEPLITTLRALCSPRTTLLLAHQVSVTVVLALSPLMFACI